MANYKRPKKPAVYEFNKSIVEDAYKHILLKHGVITVTELVQRSGLSNAQFISMFYLVFNKSAKDTIMETRMDYAEKLAGIGLSREDIAEALGYSCYIPLLDIYKKYRGKPLVN